MKALILVGGYGTRLRPLTLTCPKPLVEFANKSLVFHQIDALVSAGVTEVILAVSYQPQELVNAVNSWQEKNPNVKIVISPEDEPLGTAGPIALAREQLDDGEPFFVLNSDVVCEFPFPAMLNFHRAHGGEGTILTTPVDDPSKYGVIVSNDKGKIERFVEKPVEFVGNQINAGMYLFSSAFLKRIELKPTSIEREIFPKVAADNALFAMKLPGFWMDVGQPPDFIRGTSLYLAYLCDQHPDRLVARSEKAESPAGTFHCVGNVLVHPTARIGVNCKIGPDVVVGENCVVGDGVRLANCTLLANVSVGSNSLIDKAIIGWKSRIGRWCRVTQLSVFGEDVSLGDELQVVTTRVLPHKGVKGNITEPTIIM